MITSNPALYYTMDSKGNITYKNINKLAEALGVTPTEAKKIATQHAQKNG
jgi:NADH:ubiquinone oxidoreductase subunit E